jgi:hypothetical protein
VTRNLNLDSTTLIFGAPTGDDRNSPANFLVPIF